MYNIQTCSSFLLLAVFLFFVGSGCSGTNSRGDKKTAAVEEEALAFPGAEGGGMYTTGGRGGTVLKVTSLKDDGSEGTLRWAVNQPGPRYIVFDVSGTIFLTAGLSIWEGDLTLAGQTAPGDGICVAGYPVVVQASNVIIRYMRFRMGDDAGDELGDGADALEGRKQKNVIIDHCSISWSTDECASFYDNENFTLQWCLISESLRLSNHSKGPHGYGGIWGGVNASFHHNLMAHHDSRTPRFGPGTRYLGTERVDMCNNVFYNWDGNGCYGAEGMGVNIINNYYKPGPATNPKIKDRILAASVKTEETASGVWSPIYNKPGRFYITGNYFPGNEVLSADNWLGVVNGTGFPVDSLRLVSPVETEPLRRLQTAQDAYEAVLLYAGCSKVRDGIDIRIVEETRTGTATFHGLSVYNGLGGKWKSANSPRPGIIDSHYDTRPADAGAGWSPWPALKSEPPAIDTDGDGMPDAWEIANGLNPQVNDANGHDLSTSYENIEVYLYSLVQEIEEKKYK